jgi:hypothetical protein
LAEAQYTVTIGKDAATGRDVITVKVNPRHARGIRDVHLVLRRTKQVNGTQTDIKDNGDPAGPNDPKGDSTKDNYPENDPNKENDKNNRTAPGGWGNQIHSQTENGVTTDYLGWAIESPSELGGEGKFTAHHKGPTDPKFFRHVVLTKKGKHRTAGGKWDYGFKPEDVVHADWVEPDKWPAQVLKSEAPNKSIQPGPAQEPKQPSKPAKPAKSGPHNRPLY